MRKLSFVVVLTALVLGLLAGSALAGGEWVLEPNSPTYAGN